MKKIVLLGFVGLLLTGCVTDLPFSVEVQQELSTVETIVMVPQNTLIVSVPASNPGDTGLLGALVVAGVDAIREAEAKKAAAPILAVLESYDFRDVMRQNVTQALSSVDGTDFGTNVKLETVNSDARRYAIYDDSGDDAVLFIAVEYKLENNNLFVVADARMYPKKKSLDRYRNSSSSDPVAENSFIYRRFFGFSKQAITPENIIPYLEEAALSISGQVSDDLGHPVK